MQWSELYSAGPVYTQVWDSFLKCHEGTFLSWREYDIPKVVLNSVFEEWFIHSILILSLSVAAITIFGKNNRRYHFGEIYSILSIVLMSILGILSYGLFINHDLGFFDGTILKLFLCAPNLLEQSPFLYI